MVAYTDQKTAQGGAKKMSKNQDTISFVGRTYGKPDTDYYLHVRVQDGDEVISPAFAKHNITHKLAKDGTVTVRMTRKYAEKRGLDHLDGVTTPPKAEVEADQAAAA